MELTKEEKQVIVNLLLQISLPLSQAAQVLVIINKLKADQTIQAKK